MKRLAAYPLIFARALCLCLPALEIRAQAVWGPIDTATSGPYDDLNACVVQNERAWGSDYIFMAFERHTAEESRIVLKKYLLPACRWDTVETTLSSGPSGEERKLPACSISSWSDAWGTYSARMVAWQELHQNRWEIWYSMLADTASSWSTPLPLVADSASNTDVQIRGSELDRFLVTWKRGRALMWLTMAGSAVGTAETLAVSESESFSYDVSVLYSFSQIVWSSESPTGPLVLSKKFSTWPLAFGQTDTLLRGYPARNPRTFVAAMDPRLLVELPTSTGVDVCLFRSWSPDPFQRISQDSSATNRNIRLYAQPVITKRATSGDYPLDVVAYERLREGDSALIMLNWYSCDTVRGNWERNPVVCSQEFWNASIHSGALLVAWESNRSGTWHIYARAVKLAPVSVPGENAEPVAFALLQNFPNPFNPGTTISYEIPVACEVRLDVFDLLGREVARLVDERKLPGRHDVRFDAGALPSGLFLYRLKAGSFQQTRKMLLLH